MPAITAVSHAIQTFPPEIDGRIWVQEIQILNDGSTQTFVYLGPRGVNPTAVATVRAAAINAAAMAVGS